VKAKGLKTLKRTLISIGVLLVLAAAAGAGYVWYSGQQGPAVAADTAPQAPATSHAVPVATRQAPDAVIGASVQSIDSPVMRGQNVTLTVRTNTYAKCTISVIYDKTPSKDSGLTTKTAGDDGMVSWTWTVDTTAAFGTWPAKVTCANDKHSSVVQADLTVAKQLAN
jgi:hypothetical protein